MKALEEQIEASDRILAPLFRIAPITTMTYESNGYDGRTQEAVVREDLAHIRSLLDEGWYILGWMNQETQPAYAIGGGISGPMDSDLQDIIQRSLTEFAIEYSI